MRFLWLFLLFAFPLYADEITDSKQQYCYGYIKSLKNLYVEIKQNGTESVIAKHPPSDEGVSLEAAHKLGAEIEDDGHPQAWIELKWKTCMENPQEVMQ